jgi:hypothetical protein
MDLTPYIASVEDSLAAMTAAGDEHTQRTATALTAALEPATRLAIMDALSDLALEVSEALGDRRVELRLESGNVRVAVAPAVALEDEPLALGPEDAHGELSRITLRLPERLKTQAEHAAAAGGVSLNTWLTHAVQERLRGSTSRPTGHAGDPTGHRLRGWVHG